MVEVRNKNKTIKNKDRWNHLNHIPIQSLLGDNHCIPLFPIARSFNFLGETKGRINEFSIGYMINTTFYIQNHSEDK